MERSTIFNGKTQLFHTISMAIFNSELFVYQRVRISPRLGFRWTFDGIVQLLKMVTVFPRCDEKWWKWQVSSLIFHGYVELLDLFIVGSYIG
jgi:hypothetical protein